MKTLRIAFALTMVLATLGFAADITGKWVAERSVPTKKGLQRAIIITFDLKADGSTLSGTILRTGGTSKAAPAPIPIQEGKIDGNKVSFLTVVPTSTGEHRTHWKGTVEGNEMKGTSAVEGAPDGGVVAFIAKRR